MAHFERNVLAYVPQAERKVMAEDLREVFAVKQRSTTAPLTQTFVERYQGRFEKAVEIFAPGHRRSPDNLDFPSCHQRHIKNTNLLERLFRAQPRGLVFR